MPHPSARTALLTMVLAALSGASPTRPPGVTWTEPVTGMPFVAVPAGTFVMGSPRTEAGRDAQEAAHRVTISRPLWIGTREVTQAEDAHCAYDTTPQRDPVGRCGAAVKVIRGGSWYFTADSARCALRYTHRPQDVGFSLGFRVVRDAS